MFALFLEFGAWTRPQDLRPFSATETGLKFHMWNQGEINSSRQPGSCQEALNLPR